MSRETYYEYKNNRKEFSDAISKIEQELENVTIQKGMERSNSFVQFYMKNKFNYTDKTELEHSGKIETIQVKIDKMIDELEE